MKERILVKDAALKIGYEKDLRGFTKWCMNRRIGILKDNGSNIRYILMEEFELFADEKPTMYLKSKNNISSDEINSQIKFYSELQSAIDNKKKATNTQISFK